MGNSVNQESNPAKLRKNQRCYLNFWTYLRIILPTDVIFDYLSINKKKISLISCCYDLSERNANDIIPSYCHLPASCRSLVDRWGSLGSCKSQIYFYLWDSAVEENKMEEILVRYENTVLPFNRNRTNILNKISAVNTTVKMKKNRDVWRVAT